MLRRLRLRAPSRFQSLPIIASLAITGFVGSCASSQSRGGGHTDMEGALDEPLPVDASVIIGTLPNGLTYYVEPNSKPAGRAELRLIVKVGSVLEDEDQLGLAHVVEHMAFNGTQHFAGNDLVRHLEAMGVRFGAHLNAHTSFDETVYKLQIPTDQPGLLTQGLKILADWAQGITFDPDEVERERGVVLEEWRRSRGASGRLRDKELPLVYHGSTYADRQPIGTEESLKTFKREALLRYYRDWYRPELMAVVAVGNFDPVALEKELIALFSPLTSPDSPRERIYPELPPHDETLFGIFSDPEVTHSRISLSSSFFDPEGSLHSDYRDVLVERLAYTALNERFSDLARDPDAPFIAAGVGKQRLTPRHSAHVLGAGIKEGRAHEALDVLATELRRAQLHGFSPGEIERGRLKIMRSMQTYYDERDTTSSATHAAEILRVFTNGEAMPGIPYEWEFSKYALPTIAIDEVNAAAQAFLPNKTRVVRVVMPKKDGLTLPTQNEFETLLAAVDARDIEPRPAEDIDRPLMATLPAPGTVTSKKTFDEIGVSEWTLSNGARVVFKQTDFKADQISFSAFSPGGHSLVPSEGFISASTAATIARLSGLAEFPAAQLSKMLAGHRASVYPWVGESEEGLRGGAARDDLELLMQMSHLFFTAPRFEPEAFERYRRNRIEQLRNRLSTPQAVFHDAFAKILWQDHERYRPWTEATVEKMQLDVASKYYRERFANAGDFTFFFVGSVSEEELEPLVTRYLASLPASEEREESADVGARRVLGVHQDVVQKGIDPKSSVRLYFHGAFEDTQDNRLALDASASVLSVLLREEIRERLGGTYGISASASVSRLPTPTYSITISFQTDPDRLFGLTERLFDTIKKFKTQPIPEHYLAEYQAKARRARETALTENGFWMRTLVKQYVRGQDPREFLKEEALLDALTTKRIGTAATRYLNLENYVQLSLLPERSTHTAGR